MKVSRILKGVLIGGLLLGAIVVLSGFILTKTFGTTSMETYGVTCSSETATQVIGASTSNQRKAIAIYNSETFDVYIATYAAPVGDIADLYIIPDEQEFADSGEAYLGAWFVLSSSASSTADIRVIQTYGSNY